MGMFDRVLRPFALIITRLKYGQKFMLISVLFMIPVVILLYFWISTQQDQIRMMKNEQIGLEQVGELMPFMLKVQEHRGLVNGYLNGNREAKAQIEDKQAEVVRLAEQIEVNFRKESLPQTYEKWTAIKKEWDGIRAAYEGLKAADSFDRHSALVAEVEALIVSSADESGLSLDNEISSYYIMRMIVEELPVLIESSAIIRGQGNGVLASGTLADKTAIQLQVEAAISETALDNLNNSLAKLVNRADGELLQKGEQAEQVIRNFLVLLDRELLSGQGMKMSPDTYFAEGTTAIASAAEAFDLAAIELEHKLQERIRYAKAVRNQALWLTAVVLLLVASFYGAFYRSVMDTVRTLKQRAEAMAQGDFSQDIILNTKDELQLVGIAFNEMQGAMNRVLHNTQKIAGATLQSSMQLTTITHESTMAMQQVADAVQEVSEGTTAQQRTTGETAVTMEDMSKGVLRVAEAASEVAMIAVNANEHAERGNQQLTETVHQMASIKKTQETSSRIVAKLDEHSAHIGEIIGAIMDVASQTKLLALNANIEAARAGEHGRGFGVVAREVGKLAEETSKSGETISNLLNDMRAIVEETVSAMDSMQLETNAGMVSIERSQSSIHQILNEVRLVTEQIQEVSATSEQLSAEMEEVTASIAEIAGISHKTASEAETMAAATEEQLASTEQIQSSAEELKDMSQQLQEDLRKFKLRETRAD